MDWSRRRSRAQWFDEGGSGARAQTQRWGGWWTAGAYEEPPSSVGGTETEEESRPDGSDSVVRKIYTNFINSPRKVSAKFKRCTDSRRRSKRLDKALHPGAVDLVVEVDQVAPLLLLAG